MLELKWTFDAQQTVGSEK
ncbi:hypothetical protein [Bacillus cereus group sp. N21]